MSDRLTDLQRQRALAVERLAAIEREIAAELGGGTVPPPGRRIPAPTPSTARPPLPVAPSPEDAEAIIAQFQHQSGSVRSDVRRGCFLYFFLALALFFGGLALFYYLHRHL